MSKNNTAVVISKEAKLVTVAFPDPNMEPAGRINYFHRITKEASKLSIAAAFYAGLELMRVKRNLTQRGEFMKWVESNCDFAYRTGHNYIHVAYMCLSKAGYECDELLEGTDATRVAAIEDATKRCESDNLNEIYIELGIISKSKSKMGGRREGAGRKRKDDLAAEAERQAAALGAEAVKKLAGDIYNVAVIQGGLGNCADTVLAEVCATLDDVVREGTAILKSRKAKAK